jgi:hypothetical protein
MLLCLALTPGSRPLSGLSRATLDLADGVVAWLATRLPDMEAPPGVADLVATGRLAAFLRQLRLPPRASRPCGPGREAVGRPGERD